MIVVIIITAGIIIIPFLGILIMYYHGSKEEEIIDRNSVIMTDFSENSILNKALNNSDPYLMDMMYNPKSKNEEMFGVPNNNSSPFISAHTNNADITDKKVSNFF